MSDWLVDTHAFLWFLADDPQLSAPAMSTMESGENILLVSSASLWEVAIKSSLGRLDVPAGLPEILDEQGFSILEISARHAWEVRDLPLGEHKDPFDRLLVAQARVEDLSVISNDTRLDQYGINRQW